jgi:hypothetical protein
MAESKAFFAMSFNHFRRVQTEETPIVLELQDPRPPCIREEPLSIEIFSDEYEVISKEGEEADVFDKVLSDDGGEQDDTEGEDVVADEEAVGEASGTQDAVVDERAAVIQEAETEEEVDMDTSDMLLAKLLADALASPSEPFSPIVVATRSKRSSPCTPPGGPKQLKQMELGTKAKSNGPQFAEMLSSSSPPKTVAAVMAARPLPPPARRVPTPPSVPPKCHRVPPQPPRCVRAESHSTTWATAPPPTPPPSLVQRQQSASSSPEAAASSSSTAAGDSSSAAAAPELLPKRHKLEELVDDSEPTTTGLGKCGPLRAGKNGGRQRFGSSAGTHREYYAGFYNAKGKGNAAVAAYIEWMGPPPSRLDR